MSSPMKNKKKNKMLNPEIDEVPTKKKKKTKVANEEKNIELPVEYKEDLQENYDFDEVPLKQSSPTKRDKDGVEDDNWTKNHYKELIKRMEEQIPANDNNSFSLRAEKLDWDKIQFGSHSIEECQEKWKVLKTKVRHYRLLSEVLQDAMKWAESPWDTSLNNKKKNRHPDQPPKPLTSFMLFYMDKKEKVMKRNPDLKLPDISRIIGEKFKELSESKKLYYSQKAAVLQEEYKQNLKEFQEKHPELVPVSKPTKKSLNEQKPQPPFKLFLREKLRKHQHEEGFNKLNFVEKYKLVWKNLSLKKKASWVRLAKEEEDKYWKQMEDLSEDHSPVARKTVLTKDEKALLDRLAGKPDKPPGSAYSLFSKLMLQDKDKELAEDEPKSRMKEVANKWKQLSEQEKREYEEELKHMVENYKLEFATYLDSLSEEKRAEEMAKLHPKKSTRKPKVVKKKTSLTELFRNEPAKPPVTAWDLYKTEYIKKHKHLTSKEACKQAADSWKIMTSKEQEKYKRKHESLKAKYMHDLQTFFENLSEEELVEYASWKKKFETDESADKSSGEDDGSSSEYESDTSEQGDSGLSE